MDKFFEPMLLRFFGTVTSTLQLMRTVAGSLGVALFGSILVNQCVPAFHRATSPATVAAISPTQLSRLYNSQSYMMPGAMKQIKSCLSGSKKDVHMLVDSIQHSDRIGLADTLSDVFLVDTVFLLMGTVFSLFRREIPLRKINRSEPLASLYCKGGRD